MPRRIAVASARASSPSEATTASPAVRVPSSARRSLSVGSSTSARKPRPSFELERGARHGPAFARCNDLLEAGGRREREPEVEKRRVARRDRVDSGEHAQQVRRGGLERPRRQARAAAPVLVSGPRIRARPLRGAQPSQPRAGGARARRRRPPRSRARGRRSVQRSRAAPNSSGVSAASRVQAAAFERGSSVVVCRIQASQPEPVEPFARAGGRVVAGLRPAGHQGGEAAGLEQPGQSARELLADAVAFEAAVAEGELGVRGDDVGRVAGDAAEALAGHGLEQAACAELDVRDAVQRQVVGGEARARARSRRSRRPAPAWRASRSAWIPFPVQRSSAHSTGSRIVRWPSTADGRWTPATRSLSSTSSRSEAIRRSSCGTRRASPCRRPSRCSASPLSRPPLRALGGRRPGRRRAGARSDRRACPARPRAAAGRARRPDG